MSAAGQQYDLVEIEHELRGFESRAGSVEWAWRRRLSDVSGLSESPGEAAYVELKAGIDSLLLGDGGRGARGAGRLIDTVDELLWAAEQVGRHQLDTVRWLVGTGRLFVPRYEAAQVDVYYLRRPSGGSRPLQAKWVRTHDSRCFDELLTDLREAADHLTVASAAARRLAGTARLSRRTAEAVMRIPQPYLDGTYRIEDPGQEFGELVR
jgi:hypothetical protein